MIKPWKVLSIKFLPRFGKCPSSSPSTIEFRVTILKGWILQCCILQMCLLFTHLKVVELLLFISLKYCENYGLIYTAIERWVFSLSLYIVCLHGFFYSHCQQREWMWSMNVVIIVIIFMLCSSILDFLIYLWQKWYLEINYLYNQILVLFLISGIRSMVYNYTKHVLSNDLDIRVVRGQKRV